VWVSRDSLVGAKSALPIAKQEPAHDGGARFSNLRKILGD